MSGLMILNSVVFFSLDSDFVAIIDPLDENPLRNKNKSEISQCQYGGVVVTRDKFCGGLLFRVINTEHMYSLSSDTMIVDVYDGIIAAVHDCMYFDLLSYYYHIFNCHGKVIYWHIITI